jgi:hypothetical protein
MSTEYSEWVDVEILVTHDSEWDGEYEASIHEVLNVGQYPEDYKVPLTSAQWLETLTGECGTNLMTDWGYDRKDLPDADGIYRAKARVRTTSCYDSYYGATEYDSEIEVVPKEEWLVREEAA